jgi:hypothetical protein
MESKEVKGKGKTNNQVGKKTKQIKKQKKFQRYK